MSDDKMLDTVAEINMVIRENDWVAARMLGVVMAESLAMAMHNAVAAQHNAQVTNSAIVAAACTRILAGRNG